MTKKIRSLFWSVVTLSAFGFGGGCSCDPSIKTCPEGEILWEDPASGASMCLVPDYSMLCLYEQIGTSGGYCPEGSETYDPVTGTWDCGTNGSDCEVVDLEPGYIAQYLDSVTVPVGADGEMVAISGYSPGWLDPSAGVVPFGDLVYAEFTPGGPEVVEFEILDGKPAADTEDNVFYAPDSWRNGNSEAGDDVGQYSTITATAAGDIYIAYADFTTRGEYQLKLAYRAAAASTFTISVIDDTDPVGVGGVFYPSIAIDPTTMVPVVAYAVRQPAAAAGEQPTGWVRVATAASANPTGPADWTYAELTDTIANVGCVDADGLCAAGDRCFAAGTSGRGYCGTPDTDCRDPMTSNPITCAGMFGTVSLCVNDACQNVKGGGDLRDMVGISNNLFATATGLGLVYHDRGAGRLTATACETNAQCGAQEFCSGVVTPAVDNDGRCMIPNGNVWGMRSAGGTWSGRFLIDGYSRKVPTVGDCGLHATVALDSTGAWHVAYLDGTYDRIRYARVASAANTVAAYGFVDDGNADLIGTTRPADRRDGRRRLIGGELSIAITPTNELRLLYQDITGMENDDESVAPPGPQPLLAVSTNAGVNWSVRYATTAPVTNGGFWTTQSLGILAGSNTTSYCAWVERSSTPNSSDSSVTLVPDKADTHVVSCAAP